MTAVDRARVQEIADLLAYAAAADPRLNTADVDQAKARVVAWVDALDGVPIDYARGRVRWFYRQDHPWPITAGSIRQQWLREQARADQPALVAHAGTPVAALSPQTRMLIESAKDQIRAARAEMGWS